MARTKVPSSAQLTAFIRYRPPFSNSGSFPMISRYFGFAFAAMARAAAAS